MSCANNLKQVGIGIHNFHDTKQGIPPGRYRVYITGVMGSYDDPNSPGGEKLFPLLAQEFMFKDRTPLEIEIPGEKVFDIVVERPRNGIKHLKEPEMKTVFRRNLRANPLDINGPCNAPLSFF